MAPPGDRSDRSSAMLRPRRRCVRTAKYPTASRRWPFAERVDRRMFVVVSSIHHLSVVRVATAGIAALFACCVYAGPQSVRATYNGYINGMQAGVITEEYE